MTLPTMLSILICVSVISHLSELWHYTKIHTEMKV